MYCNQDSDCGWGSNGLQGFVNAGGSSDFLFADGTALASPAYSYKSLNVYTSSVCNFLRHQCEPRCKVGGCFCTRDNNCDSHICYKFYCKSISFVPAWTLAVSITIIIATFVLCVVYHMKCRRQYLVPGVPTTYGIITESVRKPPELIRVVEEKGISS